jgi:putative DNA primase/helicase
VVLAVRRDLCRISLQAGQIAKAATDGGGLDKYKAALTWLKQNAPTDNALEEKARRDILGTAERHLADGHGTAVLDEIYYSIFPEDAAPSNAELDAVVAATDALEYRSFGCYQMDDDGLALIVTKKHKTKKDSDDDEEEGEDAEETTTKSILISGPFEILGRVRDSKGEGWSRLLRWRDKDKRIHIYPVSDADLHGDVSALCGSLATRGLKIATGSKRNHLVTYLNDADVEGRVTEVPTTGWHDVGTERIFALPNQSIGSVEAIIVQAANNAPFKSRGTLVDWKDGVGSLVAGHTRPVFAVSTALAGPLLGLLGSEGGGFNLYGQSSRGKTTTVQAAASVWGKGDSPGFVCPWRSTANALEATAAMHTDTLLPLDELGTMDAKEAAVAAYSLAGGIGKTRLKRDASLRPSMAWRVMVLSASEVRLTDKLMEGHQRARPGQQVRLVDIPADAGKGFGAFDNGGAHGDPKALADQIKIAAQTSYGTAGPEFVRRLIVDGIDKKPDDIKAIMDAFSGRCVPLGADGQVLRVVDRFALVAAAGELACDLEIVPWQKGDALKAACRCFTDWLDSRGGAEAGEVQAAISQVRLFIENHGDSRFEPIGTQNRPVNNRAGWRKGDGSEREWLIPSETWKSEVAVGHNPKLVARVLAERGMLKRANDGFQCVERIQNIPQRVYVVTARILSEPGHE